MKHFKNWRISTEIGHKTEKKYWVNGHHVRGKDCDTFAASIGNIAAMFAFSMSNKYLSFNTYKLQ